MSGGAFGMEREPTTRASAEKVDELTMNMLEMAGLAMPRVEA